MAEHIVQKLPSEKAPLAQRIRAHIELADPVTWISPITVVIFGAIAAGRGDPGFNFTDMSDVGLMLLAVLMCGPLGTGFSQSINDYFDRDLDAINDPSRPIPSGRVTLAGARLNWIALGLGTFAISLFLAQYSLWIPVLALLSLALAAAYSVPPLKLKQHYWMGPPAVGFGYVFLTWIASHLIFAPITWPSVTVAAISSAMAAGLLFLNDIKSIEGDRQHGLKSMTVALGVRRTLMVSYLIIGICQLVLLVLALTTGHLWVTAIVVAGIVVPLYSQLRLYQEPTHKNFLRYIIASNPFVIVLQFISAFIVGGYLG